MLPVVSALVVAGLVFGTVCGQYKANGAACSSATRERQECGWGGITDYQCIQRGCCWQECHGCDAGVPWCYHSADAYRAECLVADEDKDDCGSYGIGPAECIRRGCCWTPSNRENIPWCFHEKVETTTTTTTHRPVRPPGPPQPSEGDMRLADGAGPWEGRFEVYVFGDWATICPRNFTSNVPDVICQHFGYPSGGTQRYFPGGEGEILTDTLQCPDDAQEVFDCLPGDPFDNDCTHDEDFGVTCEGDSARPDDVRLAGGAGPWEGRFEVFVGQWVTLCARNFTSNVPDVVCRHLGYPHGGVQMYFPGGEGPIVTDTLVCPDDAQQIHDCVPGDPFQHDCTHEEVFGVSCLVDGSESVNTPDYGL